MKKSKAELIITVAGITVIVVALFVICYLSIVVKSGKFERIVKNGTITMSYFDQNIAAIAPHKPMSDEEALASANYFAFKISSEETTNGYIYFDPLKDNTLDKKYVRISLSTYDGQKETIIVGPMMVTDIENYSPGYGYLLHKEEITYPIEYRFRIWIDVNSALEEHNGLKYKGRINTYGAA